MMRSALLVAHGFPSDPEPQEAAMRALALRVAALLPGWHVAGTTLAAPGALDSALECVTAPLVYPFFMAQGWFTGSELPRRLDGRGGGQLAPFGLSPQIDALVDGVLSDALAAQGWAQAETALLLAAHGSQRSRTSAGSTYALADRLRARAGWRDIRCGFVEEPPMLAEAAQGLGQAICLPFFALRAGHVIDDIPEAMEEAGFTGPVLPPLGEAPGVPALIAADLRASVAVSAA